MSAEEKILFFGVCRKFGVEIDMLRMWRQNTHTHTPHLDLNLLRNTRTPQKKYWVFFAKREFENGVPNQRIYTVVVWISSSQSLSRSSTINISLHTHIYTQSWPTTHFPPIRHPSQKRKSDIYIFGGTRQTVVVQNHVYSVITTKRQSYSPTAICFVLCVTHIDGESDENAISARDWVRRCH